MQWSSDMNERKPTGVENAGYVPRRDEDLCLDLLHDLLPSAEKETLLERLAAEPALESVFQEMVAAQERLRATRRLRLSPTGELAIEPVAGAAGRTTGTGRGAECPAVIRTEVWDRLRGAFGRPRSRLVTGFVAAAVVAFVLILPRLDPGPGDDLLRRLPAYGDDLQFRAVDDALPGDDLTAGLEAYGAGDFRRAVSLLDRAEAIGPFETVRKLYLGSALAYRGRYERAADLLATEATGNLPDPWGSEARWTLFVALRNAGSTARADSLLRILAVEPGEIGARAQLFLQGMEHD
jgi:hypothetical protein